MQRTYSSLCLTSPLASSCSKVSSSDTSTPLEDCAPVSHHRLCQHSQLGQDAGGLAGHCVPCQHQRCLGCPAHPDPLPTAALRGANSWPHALQLSSSLACCRACPHNLSSSSTACFHSMVTLPATSSRLCSTKLHYLAADVLPAGISKQGALPGNDCCHHTAAGMGHTPC